MKPVLRGRLESFGWAGRAQPCACTTVDEDASPMPMRPSGLARSARDAFASDRSLCSRACAAARHQFNLNTVFSNALTTSSVAWVDFAE
jgi:hypothetical protein